MIEDVARVFPFAVTSLDHACSPYQFSINQKPDGSLTMSVSDDNVTTEITTDAYYYGLNIIHITDRILLPESAAQFLGLQLTSIDHTVENLEDTEDAARVAVSSSSPSVDRMDMKCCVCDEYGSNILGCVHRICTSCLRQLDRAKCPTCRTDISAADFPELSASASTSTPARHGFREVFDVPSIDLFPA